MFKIILNMYCLLITVQVVMATEIVYTPINPNFGGNPNNASMLMSEAEAINTFKDSAAVNPFAQLSPLEQFNTNLQQFVLNQIAASVTGQIIDANGNLIPGTISTQDFIISIVDLGGGALEINTTDVNTGQTTSFQVN